MRVFGSVVGPQTAIVFCDNAYGSEGGRVRPKLIRHDPGWRETLLLEQLLHQLSSGFGVSLAPDEEVENLTFVVDGAPEPIAFPLDDNHYFVEVPVIAGPGAGTA